MNRRRFHLAVISGLTALFGRKVSQAKTMTEPHVPPDRAWEYEVNGRAQKALLPISKKIEQVRRRLLGDAKPKAIADQLLSKRYELFADGHLIQWSRSPGELKSFADLYKKHGPPGTRWGYRSTFLESRFYQ